MAFTEEDAEAYLATNIAHIDRLRKTITNLMTVRQVLYFTERLEQMEVEDRAAITEEWMMEVEAFRTTICISYGRLFAESNGARVLKKKLLPEEFSKTHEEVIELRNERYAHHGDHKSTAPELECFVTEHEVQVQLHWRSNVSNGAPANWKELFLWWDNFLKDSFLKQLTHLSKTSGKNWPEFEPEVAFRSAHEGQVDGGLPPLLEHLDKL